jgi:hypothetical protein
MLCGLGTIQEMSNLKYILDLLHASKCAKIIAFFNGLEEALGKQIEQIIP